MIKIILLYEVIGLVATIITLMGTYKLLAERYDTTVSNVFDAIDKYNDKINDHTPVYVRVALRQGIGGTIIGWMQFILAWPLTLPYKAMVLLFYYDFKISYILKKKKAPF